MVKYHVGFLIMGFRWMWDRGGGKKGGRRLQGQVPPSRNVFLSFTTISKGGALSREEGYNFARIQVWFTTRSGMLVALTVMEIFTIEIVNLKWRKKVTFLKKFYHKSTTPFWARKIKMKRAQIRYKGLAKKVFKKHFTFWSVRELSRC